MARSAPRLETERLILRPLEKSDVMTIYDYLTDEGAAAWRLGHVSLDLVRKAVKFNRKARWGEPGSGSWFGITTRSSTEVIGDVELHCTQPGWLQQAELGIIIAQRYRGRGYATEVAHRLFEFLFDKHDYRRICTTVPAASPAAVALCERLGMRREAHFVECELHIGRPIDRLVYALLQREWTQRAEDGLPR